jgi:hypothetical protein
MRNGSESVQTARALANNWVRKHMLKAEQGWCSCDSSDRLFGLWEFGLALHTIQDYTSPSHNGFQVWNGILDIGDMYAHILNEDFDPGPTSHLDAATQFLWGYMQCPAPNGLSSLPSDYFSTLGVDITPSNLP